MRNLKAFRSVQELEAEQGRGIGAAPHMSTLYLPNVVSRDRRH